MNDLKKETNKRFGENFGLLLIILAMVVLLVWFVVVPNIKKGEAIKPLPKEPTIVEETIPAEPTPKLVKRVDPTYPEDARKVGVEGKVDVEMMIGTDGLVKDVKVMRSDSSLLEKAAIDAVKQWVYEPMLKDGKPVEFKATVTVAFLLNADNKTSGPVGGVVGGVVPVRAIGDIKPPKLIREVAPIYPAEARLAKVEGIVILECTTDIEGYVANVKVLRSIPYLDQAAVDAVKQWQYEPMMINDKPHPVIFTVTVRFRLN